MKEKHNSWKKLKKMKIKERINDWWKRVGRRKKKKKVGGEIVKKRLRKCSPKKRDWKINNKI